VEAIDNDKHPSLLRYGIKYVCKKFYGAGPRLNELARLFATQTESRFGRIEVSKIFKNQFLDLSIFCSIQEQGERE
jgi:hypothetical protein